MTLTRPPGKGRTRRPEWSPARLGGNAPASRVDRDTVCKLSRMSLIEPQPPRSRRQQLQRPTLHGRRWMRAWMGATIRSSSPEFEQLRSQYIVQSGPGAAEDDQPVSFE